MSKKLLTIHLKHYNDLDDYIKTRENQLREELFDYYHFTNKNCLKNINSYGYTLENCIIAIDFSCVASLSYHTKKHTIIQDFHKRICLFYDIRRMKHV